MKPLLQRALAAGRLWIAGDSKPATKSTHVINPLVMDENDRKIIANAVKWAAP